MTTSSSVVSVDDGTVVVEAPSVQAALEAVTQQFGTGGEIIEAEQVSRGGVGGFFTKQAYRVVVRPAGSRDHTAVGSAPANAAPTQSARTQPVTAQPTHAQPAPVVADSMRTPIVPASDAGTRYLPFPEADPVGRDDRQAAAPGNDEEAVDRVLRQIEAADETLGATGEPMTFGEVLRAELEARGRRVATPAEVIGDSPLLERTEVIPTATQDVDIDLAAIDAPVDIDAQPAFEPIAPPESGHRFVVSPAVPDQHREPTAPGLATRQPLGRPLDTCPPGSGPVRWSADALSRLGLPYSLIEPLADLDDDDELAWVYRLSELVAPMCGAMPTDDLLLVGSDITKIGQALDLVVATKPDSSPFFGRAAVELDLDDDSESFIDAVRDGRRLHVVCSTSTITVPDQVAVVSWTEDSLSTALHMALETGAALGFVVRGEEMVRVTPFELALAVRSRLDRG